MNKALFFASILAIVVVGWSVIDRLTAPDPMFQASNLCPPPSIEVRVPADVDPSDVVITVTSEARAGCGTFVEGAIPFVSEPGKLSDDVLAPAPVYTIQSDIRTHTTIDSPVPSTEYTIDVAPGANITATASLEVVSLARPQVIIKQGSGTKPGGVGLGIVSSIEINARDVPEGFVLVLWDGPDTRRLTKAELRELVPCTPGDKRYDADKDVMYRCTTVETWTAIPEDR